ncbi:MAG TPA: hypothetical protein VLL76_10040 [Candidatus Omnitrophota bacterium]|nr:hypothetical protein [Candidatus Omnitrophota bacterium]
MHRRRKSRPGIAGNLVALVLGLVASLAVFEGMSRVAFPAWRDFHSGRFMTRTIVPGYPILAVGVAGFDGGFAHNDGDFNVRIRLNDLGLRNDEPTSAAGDRIWVIGDSFMFGWGVERDDMLSSQLAAVGGRPTFNLASPGEGLCGYQALVARMPKELRPSAMVVGITIENDTGIIECKPATAAELPPEEANWSKTGIKRMLSAYFASYNVVSVTTKRIAPLRDVLVSLGVVERENQSHYNFDPARVEESVASMVGEIAKLRALAPDVPFVALMIPARTDLIDQDPVYRAVRERLGDALRQAGHPVADPFARLAAEGLGRVHFTHDGHWSPLGHRIAAEAVAETLAPLFAATQEPAP